MLLLAVDIGNTNAKFGFFSKSRLIDKFICPTADLLGGTVNNDIFPHVPEKVVVCTVVPAAVVPLQKLLDARYSLSAHFISWTDDLRIEMVYDSPATLGVDRLVNVFAASRMFDLPCVVCSFGTATTFDVIDERKRYLGGAIAPGAAISARSLNAYTASLPLIEVSGPAPIIGTNTEGSVRAGVFWGQVSTTEGIVARLKKEIGGEAKVVATGGFAPMIAAHTDVLDHVEPDLTLKGIELISRGI